MKGIPPEIDTLMWRLAEEGGPVAQAEFESRHTRYAPELSRRIKMVAELREAGKAVRHRPTFTPRPVRSAPTPRWAVGAVVGMAVFAVGAVAYVAASADEHATKPVPPPNVNVAPPTLPAPIIVQKPDEAPVPKIEPVVPPTNDSGPVATQNDNKPHDVQIKDTSLTAAIALVAAGGGLKVDVAPGFRDQNVTLDYRGLTAIETLKAMGEQYGFTVFEQEEGHLLVVPARETTPDRRIGP